MKIKSKTDSPFERVWDGVLNKMLVEVQVVDGIIEVDEDAGNRLIELGYEAIDSEKKDSKKKEKK